jgi:hypothetical protein
MNNSQSALAADAFFWFAWKAFSIIFVPARNACDLASSESPSALLALMDSRPRRSWAAHSPGFYAWVSMWWGMQSRRATHDFQTPLPCCFRLCLEIQRPQTETDADSRIWFTIWLVAQHILVDLQRIFVSPLCIENASLQGKNNQPNPKIPWHKERTLPRSATIFVGCSLNTPSNDRIASSYDGCASC